MAAANCTCAVDGCEKHVRALGLCSRHYLRQRAFGTTGLRSFVCAQCGINFESHNERMYCSDRCNATAQKRKRGVVPLEQYKQQNRNELNYRVCEHCGKTFRANHNGAQISGRAPPQKCCSMQCRKDAAAKLRADKAPEFSRVAPCTVCGKYFRDTSKNKTLLTCGVVCAKERTRRYWLRVDTEEHRRRAKTYNCLVCGVMYSPLFALHRWVCSDECERKNKRDHKSCKPRKATKKYGGEYEPVNTRRVFERDGWRCQICGVATPESLRGKNKPRSPELDHRIPLSKGGGHTYANVQCACRKCNGEKGNSTEVGQMSLWINDIPRHPIISGRQLLESVCGLSKLASCDSE